MRRIKSNNVVYLQEDYKYNMYCLDPKSEEITTLSLYVIDDYHIGLETPEYDKKNKEEFSIETDNLFYQGFLSFLGDEKEFVIEDDLGFLIFGKKLTIKKMNDMINLIFEYERRQELSEYDIHIINVGQDMRSLVDQQGKDTKERLSVLFEEIFKEFNNYDEDYDGPVIKKQR